MEIYLESQQEKVKLVVLDRSCLIRHYISIYGIIPFSAIVKYAWELNSNKPMPIQAFDTSFSVVRGWAGTGSI